MSKKLFKKQYLSNGVSLKNRFVMAPMTTSSGFYTGEVTKDIIEFYKKRAGFFSAIIVECGYIERNGLAFPGAIGLDSDDKIEGLSKLASTIKKKGSKAIIQVYHGGRMTDPKLIGGDTPVGPSAVAAARPGAIEPIELSSEQIDELLDKFGKAFKRAIKAGFDGIEIHGANTYLIQQFYSPHSNRRNDKWGGDRDKRALFPLSVLEIAHKARKKYASKDFIIGYRFSPEEIENPGIRFDDTIYLLEKLAKVGLDYIHFSMGYTLNSSLVDIEDSTPLIKKYIKKRSSRLAKIPIIGVGAVVNKKDAEIALDSGYDLVAIGKAAIAYPDWVKLIKNGEILDLVIPSDKREKLEIPMPLWNFSLVNSLIRDLNFNENKFKPGVYKETFVDEGLNLTIKLKLSNENIEDLNLVNIKELSEPLVYSFNVIKDRILDANSPYVDSVTGATTQSELIKKAVGNALAKARKEAILESGGDPNQNKVTDIVVVGSGGAGLSAAIQAYDEGAKVIVIEKMPTIGGNTIKASAGMNAAETKFQKKKGLKDSKELFYKETLKGGKNKNNPELLRYYINHSAEAIHWLDSNGIELSDITITGGMSVERTHRPATKEPVGRFIISGLLKGINKRNIEIILETRLVQIIQDENKKVTGIRIRKENGEESIIDTRAVIIATGGFSANLDMVVRYRPELSGFVTTNIDGSKGDGIEILESLGAKTIDMSEIQIHPTVEQKTSYLISESIRGSGAILVSQSGQRFINELETRDVVSNAIISLPEKYSYILFDQQIRDNNKSVEEYISKGLVSESSNLSELAEMLNINADVLIETVGRYNQFVEEKQDKDFGRTTGMPFQINQPPFYAIKIAPGIHHTMGGISINTEAEVVDKNNNVIQGIFAAGEVVGGIHGANRIGGNAVADIIIFGTRAGKKASEFIKK